MNDRHGPDLRAWGLAIAHPGHELRLTRWIAAMRPTVFILATGSRTGSSVTRVEASRRLITGLGGEPSGVFGRCLDREIYGWILRREARPFEFLATELADAFVRRRLDAVVTDGWQLYSVVHDLWHLTVRAGARLAGEALGRPVEVVDYPVVPEALSQRAPGPSRMVLDLSMEELDAKLQLAADYPEISGDLAQVIGAGGREFLAREALHELRPLGELLPQPGEQPAYERYGEARVAAGLYAQVLRWSHVEPIAVALSLLGGARAAA